MRTSTGGGSPRDGLLLGAGVNLIVAVEQQIATSSSGWFTFGDVPDEVPPNWKQSMIVLLTLYPIVMLELLFLNPLLHSLGKGVEALPVV